jgi:hypothetical protein
MAKSTRDTDETSFKADREFSYDCPDDDATLAEKIEYQRKLRHYCENCQPPSRQPFISPNENRWWAHPEGRSPQQIQYELKREMKRYERQR